MKFDLPSIIEKVEIWKHCLNLSHMRKLTRLSKKCLLIALLDRTGSMAVFWKPGGTSSETISISCVMTFTMELSIWKASIRDSLLLSPKQDRLKQQMTTGQLNYWTAVWKSLQNYLQIDSKNWYWKLFIGTSMASYATAQSRIALRGPWSTSFNVKTLKKKLFCWSWILPKPSTELNTLIFLKLWRTWASTLLGLGGLSVSSTLGRHRCCWMACPVDNSLVDAVSIRGILFPPSFSFLRQIFSSRLSTKHIAPT